jgi:hypothetical protein
MDMKDNSIPENLTWSQVPNEAWRLIEELSWGALAISSVRNNELGICGLPPVSYPAKIEATSH